MHKISKHEEYGGDLKAQGCLSWSRRSEHLFWEMLHEKIHHHIRLVKLLGTHSAGLYLVHPGHGCWRLLHRLGCPSWKAHVSWPAPSHPCKPVILKLHCASGSPGVLVKTQITGDTHLLNF